MNDHDDRLRRVLHEEAQMVKPEGTFDDVGRRIGRPRWVLPAAAAAAALAAVVGAVVLLGGDDDESVIADAPATTTITEPPATTTMEPATTTTAPTPVDEGPGQGVWPFRTGAEADAWAAENESGGTFRDPDATARAFAREVLGFATWDQQPFQQGDSRSGEVVLRTNEGRNRTVVLLRLIGTEPVWTVIGAQAEHISVSRPEPLAMATSPLPVSGESCCSFEGTVVLEVRDDQNRVLGQVPVIGGQASTERFETDVPFSRPSTPGGYLIAYTESAEDGSVEKATVIRLWFSQ